MILANKINNELSVYVIRTKIERRHEVVLLEITFGEECNFKVHIEYISYVEKYNLSCHVRVSEWIYTLWFAWMSWDALPKAGAISELSVRLWINVYVIFFFGFNTSVSLVQIN